MKQLLDRLFGKSQRPRSRDEYWSYWRIESLLDDLEDAHKKVSLLTGGYSGDILSAEEFAKSLRQEIDNLKTQEFPDLTNVWLWFAPTGAWDDFVGVDKSGLGDRIFEQAALWKRKERKPVANKS